MNSAVDTSYQYYGEMRPFAHQVKGIKFMLSNKRGYLWMDMGTGKTATSLWTLDMLIHYGKISKVLIIAPLSTLYPVWVREVSNICPYNEYVIVHGNRTERIAALNKKCRFYITNTDAVRNFEKELTKLKPDVIIIDEITSFANAQSKRSKAMQRLAATVKSVFGLSGAPTAGGVLNSYGIAKIVRPDKLPTPFFTKYRDMLLTQINMYHYEEKPDAVKIVNEVLQPAYKVSLEECIDLPPITFESRVVEVPAETYHVFNEMLKHQIAEYKEGVITAATAGVKAIRLVQILTGSTKNEDGEIVHLDIKPKLMELINLYHESGNKLVIFAQSVPAVKKIHEFMLSKKLNSRMIYGEVKNIVRSAIINEFQGDSDGILVAQVRTMSHGITLTSSNTIVFFGPISGNETYRQAIRRIRRIGQTKKQRIIKLISTKFEDKMFDNLDKFEDSSQAMLELYDDVSESYEEL